MGNTNSTFKDLPLASQTHSPFHLLGPHHCRDQLTTLAIDTKHSLSTDLIIKDAALGRQLFTAEHRSLTVKCSLLDRSGSTVATIRGSSTGKYTVHLGKGGGMMDSKSPAAMSIKRHTNHLEITTSKGATMTVKFGSGYGYIFLGDTASTTAPLIARISQNGNFSITWNVEIAPGVDVAAMAALFVVIKMITDSDSTLIMNAAIMNAR
ncbi:hypothetical protein H9P43_009912 [Blastocladiella emersonii ATCC 22665]|nr:hypothetical protein H9P43_009912 [Blastocladiella emersonii ATCC 22665]